MVTPGDTVFYHVDPAHEHLVPGWWRKWWDPSFEPPVHGPLLVAIVGSLAPKEADGLDLLLLLPGQPSVWVSGIKEGRGIGCWQQRPLPTPEAVGQTPPADSEIPMAVDRRASAARPDLPRDGGSSGDKGLPSSPDQARSS